MPTVIILLRAVNVGGTGKLPMATFRAMAAAAGLANPRTYIASGNMVAESTADPARVGLDIERQIGSFAGQPGKAFVRTAAEMADVLSANPFPEAPPDRVLVFFLDGPPPPDVEGDARGRTDEAIASGKREVYVHYPSGQGRSKLRIPAAEAGTARNINTIARLVEMAGDG